jgi:hypothetical protein
MARPDAAEQAAVAQRRTRAIARRIDGATWQQIADAEPGYSDRAAACKDVQRALEAARTEMAETAEELRQLEVERLDRLIRAAVGVLDRRHVVVSHGRIVREGKPYVTDEGTAEIAEGAGSPLIDDTPTLQAIDRVMRLSESKRRLLGLDAPAKAEFSTGPGETFIAMINLKDLED